MQEGYVMNRTEELIKSNEFVKEPVDKIINSIIVWDKITCIF